MKPKLLKGKKLTKALDDKIREIFKAKYGSNPTCFVCGHKDQWYHPQMFRRGVQVGHYISRTRTILRWNLRNLFPQCSSCNIIHNTNPAPFTIAIINMWGAKEIGFLNELAKSAVGNRVTDTQKRQWLEELTTLLHTFDKPTVMC